jgi:HEAT repeat protein
VTALRDDQVEVLKSAIAYLQARPALESVPELIELLRAPSKEIRDQATAALVDIKKHFEAQAEWQRWYDETKKALRK